MILHLLSVEKPASSWILKHILDKNVHIEKRRNFLRLAGALLAFEASSFMRWKVRRIKISKDVNVRVLEIDRYPLIVVSGESSKALAEGVLELFYDSSVVSIDNIEDYKDLLEKIKTTKLIIVDKQFPSEDKLLSLLEKMEDVLRNVIILSIVANFETLKKLSSKVEDLIIITFLIK